MGSAEASFSFLRESSTDGEIEIQNSRFSSRVLSDSTWYEEGTHAMSSGEH